MKDIVLSTDKHPNMKNREIWFLLILLFIMFAWKAILLVKNAFPFNSDEAIVALMAKHILLGERPIFFYGQAYMGSLDAYLVAIGFRILGQKVIVIRIVQSILYACTIVISYFIGKMAFQSISAARISAALLVIPTVNATLYTTVSLGGYGEALLLGVLQIYLALSISKQITGHKAYGKRLFLMAFSSGLGLWANGLTMVFTIPAWFFMLWQFIRKSQNKSFLIRKMALIITGGLLGLFPIIIFVLQDGLQAVWMELFGSAVSVEQSNWFLQAGNHLLYFILFGVPVILGVRPPWTSELQLIWLIPLLMPLVLGTGYQLYRDLRHKELPDAAYLLIGIILILIAAFVGTSFGVDPSGRYFVALIIPLALLAGFGLDKLVRSKWLIAIFLLAFLVYQGSVTWNLANHKPYITTQFYTPAMVNHEDDEALMVFLRENQLTYGYTNYWVAYPIAFLSDEELVYIPALPYHPDLKFTPRDNRYTPYNTIVESSDSVSYIVTNNPELDSALNQIFAQNEIRYDYHEIGDFHIYFNLSSVIRPGQFNLLEFVE